MATKNQLEIKNIEKMTLDMVIEIIYKTIPKEIDLTPKNKFVASTFDYGEKEYFENASCGLNIVIHDKELISLYYYSESDKIFDLEDNESDTIDLTGLDEKQLIEKLTRMFTCSIGNLNKLKNTIKGGIISKQEKAHE
jgi:hypothetical protein